MQVFVWCLRFFILFYFLVLKVLVMVCKCCLVFKVFILSFFLVLKVLVMVCKCLFGVCLVWGIDIYKVSV
jgi:hypothetical protein